MWHRRDAVESGQVIEVGLDELLGFDDQRPEDDTDLGIDGESPADEPYLGESREDEPYLSVGGESREDEPDLAGAAFSAAFFGWLVAGSTVVLLAAWVGVVCSLIGWGKIADWAETDAGPGRLLVGGWIVLVLTMGIGAFSGGYAGGRMVRSHGGRQGLGVWFFGWLAAGLIVGLGYAVDRKYEISARIDWPAMPIAEADRLPAALLASMALLLVTLLGAILGGAAGTRCCMRLGWLPPPQQSQPPTTTRHPKLQPAGRPGPVT